MPIKTITSPPAKNSGQNACYRLREDVVLIVAEDGSGRLIDLSGEVLAITRSGVQMLECVMAQDFDSARRILALLYSVDQDRIASDMSAFLASLNPFLVAPGNMSGSSVNTIAAIVCWLMAPGILISRVLPRHLVSAKAHLLLLIAFVSIRLFGWANTIRVWRSAAGPLPADGAASDARELLDIIDTKVARTLASFPLSVSCKERALTCYVLARAAGAKSRVIIGVDLLPFAMHCWCDSDARVIADRPDSCERFTPVLTYG